MIQSMTEPPVLQAPRQCHRFFSGVRTSEGSRSLWKGQRPTRLAPCLVQLDAGGLHQALDGDFTLEPLDLFVRDTRHETRPPSKIRQLTSLS